MSVAQTQAPEAKMGWEARHKHTSFYQALLGSSQQAAIAWNATSALMLTLGFSAARFSGVEPGQDWTILYTAALGWLFLTGVLTVGFAKSARRVRSEYLREYAALFPENQPYRPESFVLDFADRNPFSFRDEPAAREDAGPATPSK